MLGMTMVQNPAPHGDGVQRKYTFANGTMVSAVKASYSYGGSEGLWEIAVLDRNGTFLTQLVWDDLNDDVIGYLNDDELKQHLETVSEWDLTIA